MIDKLIEQRETIKFLEENQDELLKIMKKYEELQINGLRQEILFKLKIKRLNNIINELEKYIIDFKEDYEKNEFQPNAKVYIYWKDLIDKIQELKGSDK